MQEQMRACRPIQWPNRPGKRTFTRKLTFRKTRLLDRQIVLTGRPDEIDEVLQAAQEQMNAKKFPVKISGLLDVFRLDELLSTGREMPAALQAYAGLEIRLYDLQGDESESAVWEAVKLIHQKAGDLKKIVFADPNFVAGDPVSGGSGGVEGGPEGNTGGPAPKDAFLEHWSFGAPLSGTGRAGWGINLIGQNQQRPKFTGKGVRIVIFDTYDERLGQPVEVYNTQTTQESYEVLGYTEKATEFRAPAATLEEQTKADSPREPASHESEDEQASGLLQVQHPALDNPLFLCVSRPQRAVPINVVYEPAGVDEHGLFVSGLLNRVAPDAYLQLVRVLNNQGQGELFTLTRLLFGLIVQALEEPADSALPLADTVVNLSLEASISEDAILALRARETIVRLWERVRKSVAADDPLFCLLDDVVQGFHYAPCLRIPIQILHRLGAVIVAAAGNGSADRYGHLPMQIPARYPEVIGVAASNWRGQLACFSNYGDVLAPGGGPDESECAFLDLNVLCQPGCDCRPYALISLVPPTDTNKDGLAYWWGTSFATPLVSGLAALMIEKQATAGRKALFPHIVQSLILGNTRNGVIDVQATLDSLPG